jgi:hypothetical protein
VGGFQSLLPFGETEPSVNGSLLRCVSGFGVQRLVYGERERRRKRPVGSKRCLADGRHGVEAKRESCAKYPVTYLSFFYNVVPWKDAYRGGAENEKSPQEQRSQQRHKQQSNPAQQRIMICMRYEGPRWDGIGDGTGSQ